MGMFITYFVILVQFSPGLTSGGDSDSTTENILCNNTSLLTTTLVP